MNEKLIEQIKEVLNEQKELFFYDEKEKFILKGEYEYVLNNISISKIYEGKKVLEIHIPKDFPLNPPEVIINNVDKKFEHVYNNGKCCLGSIGEINCFLSKSPTLKEFIKKFINSYIYSLEYFSEYGVCPFGERSHGIKGSLEYYKEKFNIDKAGYLRLVEIVEKGKVKGHIRCICNSNKRIRNCHIKEVLEILNNENFRIQFLKEAEKIKSYFNR